MTEVNRQYREQSPLVRFGEGWASPNKTALDTPITMKANQKAIPDQSQPGSLMATPTIVHQNRDVKYATDTSINVKGFMIDVQQTSQSSQTTRTSTQFYPPTQRRHLLHLVFQHKRHLTLHTFLISIYNRSVILIFTPFKLQDN